MHLTVRIFTEENKDLLQGLDMVSLFSHLSIFKVRELAGSLHWPRLPLPLEVSLNSEMCDRAIGQSSPGREREEPPPGASPQEMLC